MDNFERAALALAKLPSEQRFQAITSALRLAANEAADAARQEERLATREHIHKLWKDTPSPELLFMDNWLDARCNGDEF